jgi:hypothetical protein
MYRSGIAYGGLTVLPKLTPDQFKKLCGARFGDLSSSAIRQCNGTEAFELIGNESIIDFEGVARPRPSHSLSYLLSAADLQKLSPNVQKLACMAININDMQLNKGKIHEATGHISYLAMTLFPLCESVV